MYHWPQPSAGAALAAALQQQQQDNATNYDAWVVRIASLAEVVWPEALPQERGAPLDDPAGPDARRQRRLTAIWVAQQVAAASAEAATKRPWTMVRRLAGYIYREEPEFWSSGGGRERPKMREFLHAPESFGVFTVNRRTVADGSQTDFIRLNEDALEAQAQAVANSMRPAAANGARPAVTNGARPAVAVANNMSEESLRPQYMRAVLPVQVQAGQLQPHDAAGGAAADADGLSSALDRSVAGLAAALRRSTAAYLFTANATTRRRAVPVGLVGAHLRRQYPEVWAEDAPGAYAPLRRVGDTLLPGPASRGAFGVVQLEAGDRVASILAGVTSGPAGPRSMLMSDVVEELRMLSPNLLEAVALELGRRGGSSGRAAEPLDIRPLLLLSPPDTGAAGAADGSKEGGEENAEDWDLEALAAATGLKDKLQVRKNGAAAGGASRRDFLSAQGPTHTGDWVLWLDAVALLRMAVDAGPPTKAPPLWSLLQDAEPAAAGEALEDDGDQPVNGPDSHGGWRQMSFGVLLPELKEALGPQLLPLMGGGNVRRSLMAEPDVFEVEQMEQDPYATKPHFMVRLLVDGLAKRGAEAAVAGPRTRSTATNTPPMPPPMAAAPTVAAATPSAPGQAGAVDVEGDDEDDDDQRAMVAMLLHGTAVAEPGAAAGQAQVFLIHSPHTAEYAQMVQHVAGCDSLGLSVQRTAQGSCVLVSIYAPCSMVMDAAGNVAREGFETATYVLDLTSGNAATALAASAAAEGRHVDAAELDAASAAEQQGVLALIDGLRQLLENPGQHKIVYGAEQAVSCLEVATGATAVAVLDVRGLAHVSALHAALVGTGVWTEAPELLAALVARHATALRDDLWAADGRDWMWLQQRPLADGVVLLAAAGCRHLPELWTSLIDERRLADVAYQAATLRLQAPGNLDSTATDVWAEPSAPTPDCAFGPLPASHPFAGYPCPPAPLWHRLLYHAARPGHLHAIAFFNPINPADIHDGISFAVFIAGGTLAALLGPASPSERRRGLARLVWLMAVVMLPKGFTVMYGLLNPGASMGEAANVMLPRHVAIVMWLAFAFPLTWRRQALLAATYAAHMLMVIRMLAVRGWPYTAGGAAATPAALSAKLLICGALLLRRAAAFGAHDAHAGARRQHCAGAAGRHSRGPQELTDHTGPEQHADPDPGALAAPHAAWRCDPQLAPAKPAQPSAAPQEVLKQAVAVLARPPRYRSVSHVRRVHVKMPGAHAAQLGSGVVTALMDRLAEGGYVLTGIAVREGCIEAVLELEQGCAPVATAPLVRSGLQAKARVQARPAGAGPLAASGRDCCGGAETPTRLQAGAQEAEQRSVVTIDVRLGGYLGLPGGLPSAAIAGSTSSLVSRLGYGGLSSSTVPSGPDAAAGPTAAATAPCSRPATCPGLSAGGSVVAAADSVRGSATGFGAGDAGLSLGRGSSVQAQVEGGGRYVLRRGRLARRGGAAAGSSGGGIGAAGSGTSADTQDWDMRVLADEGDAAAGFAVTWVAAPPVAEGVERNQGEVTAAALPPCFLLQPKSCSSNVRTAGAVVEVTLLVHGARGGLEGAQRDGSGVQDPAAASSSAGKNLQGNAAIPRNSSSSSSRHLRTLRVRFDSTDAVPGLVTFGIFEPTGTAGTAPRLLGTCCSLALPPRLTAVAVDLAAPLAADAAAAVQAGDSAAASSVSDLLHDMHEWLSNETYLLQPAAATAAAQATELAEAAPLCLVAAAAGPAMAVQPLGLQQLQSLDLAAQAPLLQPQPQPQPERADAAIHWRVLDPLPRGVPASPCAAVANAGVTGGSGKLVSAVLDNSADGAKHQDDTCSTAGGVSGSPHLLGLGGDSTTTTDTRFISPGVSSWGCGCHGGFGSGAGGISPVPRAASCLPGAAQGPLLQSFEGNGHEGEPLRVKQLHPLPGSLCDIVGADAMQADAAGPLTGPLTGAAIVPSGRGTGDAGHHAFEEAAVTSAGDISGSCNFDIGAAAVTAAPDLPEGLQAAYRTVEPAFAPEDDDGCDLLLAAEAKAIAQMMENVCGTPRAAAAAALAELLPDGGVMAAHIRDRYPQPCGADCSDVGCGVEPMKCCGGGKCC
eukprot:XP_001691618.1 predicted protein [Chlamydomonas reinhardtii]